MKLQLIIPLFLACMAANATAATYSFKNGTGATAAGIIDLDGGTFRRGTAAGDAFSGAAGGFSAGGGVIAFGIFTTDDFQGGLDASSLISAFTSLGNMTTDFGASGPVGNRSVFSFSPPNVEIEGSVFEGKNIYMFVGNGSSFIESDQFLIVRSDSLFSAADDEEIALTPITFNPETSTVLFGSVVSNVFTADGDTSQTQGWSLAAIPEPSTAMLGALSALALIRRKR